MFNAAGRFLSGKKILPTPPALPENVIFQMPFDGPDGSVNFTDLRAHAVTRVGAPVISTARSAGGGSSGLFNGAGDYLTMPASADWALGSGDFTLEGFIYAGDTTPTQYMLGNMHGNDGNVSYAARVKNKRLEFTSWTNLWITGATDITPNAWHHWAISRVGNVLYLGLDGKIDGSVSVPTMNFSSTVAMWIGHVGDGATYWNGNLDDIRMLKGQGLYTSEYTVPTPPFPTL